MLFQPILNGRDSVRKVLETFRQRGGSFGELAELYYGQIIENFDCEKSIHTAVEVTAGNRYSEFKFYIMLEIRRWLKYSPILHLNLRMPEIFNGLLWYRNSVPP